MTSKPFSPKMHGLSDYALLAGLLVLPRALGLSKPVQKIYAAEALGLLGYVAMTRQPAAVKPVIPFRTHGKIDPFNILYFAGHSFWKPFRRDKRAMKFNIAFTSLAALVNLLTDWSGRTQPKIS